MQQLTKRQREALVLKANGNTNAQIATWLRITEDAVEQLLTRTYRRLGVNGACQAVAVGIAVGEVGVHQIFIPDEQRDAA